jgi:hypothetical protein
LADAQRAGSAPYGFVLPLTSLELTEHARTGSLACCHGFDVAAGDGPVGRVETPVFSGTSVEPHSLLVRTNDAIPGTFAAVATARVAAIDDAHRRITLDGNRDELFGVTAGGLPPTP